MQEAATYAEHIIDVGRRTPQVFEVRKGNNPDMHLAVVRKMIVIIREHAIHQDQ